MNDNALVLQRGDTTATKIGAILPANVQEAITLAKTMFASKLFPDLQSAEQAVVKILAGAELGLPPFSSLNGFHIVKGKVMLHYSIIAMRVKAVGYRYKLLEDTDECQSIEFYDTRGEVVGISRFTSVDAKRVGTQNMDRMPRTMMFARAMSNGARRFVPEAFNGAVVYSYEERAELEADAESTPVSDNAVGTSSIVAAKIAVDDVPEEYNPFPVQEELGV